MATTQGQIHTPERAERLRKERDTFVALAFSTSDILLELDDSRRIQFAAGATQPLLGREPEQLAGLSFLDLAAPADRPMVEDALSLAGGGRRLGGLVVRLQGRYGVTPPMTLLGYQLPSMAGHFFLGLRMADAASLSGMALPRAEGARPTASGLPDAESFARNAGKHLTALARDGIDSRMTMLRLDALDSLKDRLDDEAATRLAESIGGTLRSSAIAGEMASEIDPENYSLIHRSSLDVDSLVRRLGDLARNADPSGRGVRIRKATMEVGTLPEAHEESAKALAYIFNRFSVEDPDEFNLQSLTQGLEALMRSTRSRIESFKSLLDTANFRMAFQPIVDLATGRPHHFEALVRLGDLPLQSSPYETIVFAEQTGLIRDFDLAVCAKVLEWLENTHLQGFRYKVAVNLSGTSINSPHFVAALGSMLQSFTGERQAILFEITESAKIRDLDRVNAAIQKLRRAGHMVCLDDFGAGSAAFEYLRRLEVDIVKIDGAYVREALDSKKGKAFLRAMSGLCAELGITTIAEMVEDQRSVGFLRDCGIAFGQGYLFGRPSFDIASFEAPKPVRLGSPGKRIL